MKNTYSAVLAQEKGPLYIQVKKELVARMAARVYVPGQRLPTEKELGAEFGVSVATIRQAVGALESEGVLIRRQGSGTYVAQHQLMQRRAAFLRLYDENERRINPRRKLLSITVDSATDRETELLNLPYGGKSKVIRYRFIGTNQNDAPIFSSVLEMVVPHNLFSKLTKKSFFKDEETNQYGLYAEVCGIQVISLEESVYAKPLPREFSDQMKLKAGTPVLYIERVSYTFNKFPVEIRWRYVHPDYHYKVTDN